MRSLEIIKKKYVFIIKFDSVYENNKLRSFNDMRCYSFNEMQWKIYCLNFMYRVFFSL